MAEPPLSKFLLKRLRVKSPQHVALTPMDKCPPEICLIICTLATFADDGSTGCSLSLVSRYIHNVSKPVKLQSVSIRHLDNLRAFAKVLETSPPKLRRVRHLLFSTHDQSAGPDRQNYIHDTRKLEDAH